MSIVIIGGTTGLGGKIHDYFIDSNHSIVVIGKSNGFDINNIPTIVEEVAKSQFNGVIFNDLVPDLIILNAFDHDHPVAQQALFDALWDQYKNSNITFMVMGSTAKMWGWNASSDIAKDYSKAKKKLYESVFYKVWEDSTTAKAILIEPSFVENVVDYFVDRGQLYLSYDNLLSMIEAGLSLNKFMKLVVLSGKGLYTKEEIKGLT